MQRVVLCICILAMSSGCAFSRLWEPSREEVLDRILASSVQVVLERDGKRYRSGSAVAIAARPSGQGTECFVLTAGHTLSRRAGQDSVFILFDRQHGKGKKAPAAVVGHRESGEADLALLRTHSDRCFPADFGPLPRLGDSIWVAAYPWGRNLTLVGGVVSQINTDRSDDPETAPHLIVDASVSYGSSGGGVYDARGGLVGLVEGYRTARVPFNGEPSQYIDVPVPGETYVVPLADIRQFLLETDPKDLQGGLPTTARSHP